MVFIHGGGNQQGSASPLAGEFFIYDGKLLAARGDVVVVTLNYRLGPLGYLVHPAISQEQGVPYAGNYGILDQILALKWVKDNITQFGGDPNRVMLFGESAGAVNVSLHLVSPLSQGLFSRALIESGAPIPRIAADASADGIEFAQQFGCTGAYEAQLACLRALPADRITATLSSPLENGLVKLGWDPIIDGYVIPDEPFKLIQRGDFNKVPLVVGSNADEMSLSTPPIVTPNQVRLLFDVYVPEAFEAEGLTLYPPGNTNLQARQSYVQATTDAQFTAPTRRLASAISTNQSEPVYRYFFSHALSGASGIFLGAAHGIELPFVFQTIESSPYSQSNGLTVNDHAVAKWCLEYWTQLAKDGDPNGNGLPKWNVYNATTDDYLELKGDPTSGLGLRTQKSDYWDRVRNGLM
jgi:para-nitrobenzyl esterase